jgi:hypothetical protein
MIFEILFVLIIIYSINYFFLIVKKPELIYEHNELNDKIIKNMKGIHENFYPNFFFINCHLQTVIGDLIRENINIKYERDYIKTEDNGELAIDHFNFNYSKKSIIILYPGIFFFSFFI